MCCQKVFSVPLGAIPLRSEHKVRTYMYVLCGSEPRKMEAAAIYWRYQTVC
jgi:hypothetical protein